eukprot:COSAG02_NODE_50371_length_321_cov_0.486486_1_plen_42_part_10
MPELWGRQLLHHKHERALGKCEVVQWIKQNSRPGVLTMLWLK